MIVNCSNCGKELNRFPCDIKYYKNLFCNIKCKSEWMKGKKMQKTSKNKHWNWQGGRGKSFAERHIDANICEICGSIKSLDRHHIDGNQNNNSIENIMIVCRSCHMKLHRRGKK